MIRTAALAAYKAGLCILPTATDRSKAPAIKPWGSYKTVRASAAEMKMWRFDQADGFGVVAGAVSGYVECWDFDDEQTCLAFEAAAQACGLGVVWGRLTAGYLDRTPGGGWRVLVRYPPEVLFTDCTLARRPGGPGEPPIKTLIELPTFAIVAPSNGRTHPSGGTYTRISGGFDTIASYTTDERAALLALARTFDEMLRPEVRPGLPVSDRAGTRPGDDYNRRMTWRQLLEPNNWTLIFERDAVGYWRRPGKTFGVSATTNYGGSDLLYVFSSSTVFDPDTSYSKFAACAVLEHDGDFSRAALALFKRGYGDDPVEPDAPKADPGPDTTGASTSSSSTPAAAPSRALRLTAASTMTIRPVRWLWDERIPVGTFTLIGGREGVGKSIVTYTIAADLTKGILPGIYAGVPKAVIVAATEDSWEHVIVPRLLAAGADLDRVFRADIVDAVGVESLSLPKDMAALSQAITDVDAALVVFDPLLSRVDARLDTHKDADVRRALEPLAAIADATRAVMIGLIHVSKARSSDVLTLLMASRAFTAVARAVLFVAVDPDDEGQRLLSLVKSNLGRIDLPMLQFRIRGALVTTTADGDEVWTGHLTWTGESERTMREVLDRGTEREDDRRAVHEARDWLVAYLTEAGGCGKRRDAVKAGHEAGHSRPTLDRARRLGGIQSTGRGYPNIAYWMLPPTSAGPKTQNTQTTQDSGSTISESDSESTAEATGALGSSESTECSESAECSESTGAAEPQLTRRKTQFAGDLSLESSESSEATEPQLFKDSPSALRWQEADARFKKGWGA